MVTVSEARQQLEARRKQIEATRLASLTAAQLRRQTRLGLAQRGLSAQQLEAQKRQALVGLKPFETEIGQVEQAQEQERARVEAINRQIAEQNRDIEIVNKFLREGKSPVALTKTQKKLFREAREGLVLQPREKITIIPLGAKTITTRLQKQFLEPKEKITILPLKARTITTRAEALAGLERFKFERITFGQPEKFAESFKTTTGAKTFTLAIPIGREGDKIRVQDFTFKFRDGKLIETIPRKSGLIKEETFLAADKRRRDLNPEFTFGDTRLLELTPTTKLERAIVFVLTLQERAEKKFGLIRKGEERKQKLLETPANELSRIERIDQARLQANLKKNPDELMKLINKGFNISADFLLALAEKVPFKKELEKFIGEKVPISKITIPKAEAEKIEREIVSTFLKFAFFAPAFSVATKGKAKGKVKVKQKQVKAKKTSAKNIIKKLEESFKKQGEAGVRKNLEEISKFVKNQKDPALKKIAIDNQQKILLDMKNKGLIKDFVLNTETGEVSFLGTPKPLPTIVKPSVEITIGKPPKLEAVGEVSGVIVSAARAREIKRQIDAQAKNQAQIERAQMTPSQRLDTSPLEQQLGSALNQQRFLRAQALSKSRLEIAQVKSQISKESFVLQSMIAQKQPQQLIQQQRNKIAQMQRTAQRTMQRTAQALKTAQLQRTAQRTAQRQKAKLKQIARLRKLKRPKRLFLLPKVKPKKKKKKKPVIPPTKIGHNVFVKRKGKFKKVNVNPLTKAKARDLGAFLTDKSVARTFKVKKSGTIANKPKLKVPPSYFKKHEKKFRGRKVKGKVQPIKRVAIEKSKFAIDSRGEKLGLSAARVRSNLLRKAGLKKPIKKRKKK